jgi:hypothetical protein
MITAETRDREDVQMGGPDSVDPAGFAFPLAEETQEEGEDLMKRFLRVWMNERSAPEILPFQFEAIQDIMELINLQVPQ